MDHGGAVGPAALVAAVQHLIDEVDAASFDEEAAVATLLEAGARRLGIVPLGTRPREVRVPAVRLGERQLLHTFVANGGGHQLCLHGVLFLDTAESQLRVSTAPPSVLEAAVTVDGLPVAADALFAGQSFAVLTLSLRCASPLRPGVEEDDVAGSYSCMPLLVVSSHPGGEPGEAASMRARAAVESSHLHTSAHAPTALPAPWLGAHVLAGLLRLTVETSAVRESRALNPWARPFVPQLKRCATSWVGRAFQFPLIPPLVLACRDLLDTPFAARVHNDAVLPHRLPDSLAIPAYPFHVVRAAHRSRAGFGARWLTHGTRSPVSRSSRSISACCWASWSA